jgi:pimeloyl-ACP methyl ester carboxylesterase
VGIAVLAVVLAVTLSIDAWTKDKAMEQRVFHPTVKVDGLSIFFREAGSKDAPVILLLHARPSSRMFQPLLPGLADSYHLDAPDHPGFGYSDWLDPKQIAYTFDRTASVMDDFPKTLGLSHYALYMQDYGGSVGFRMASVHPERVQGLIVLDAVADNEGFGAKWAARRAFQAERPVYEENLRTNLLSLATAKTRNLGTVQTSSSTIRICGPTSIHFLVRQGRRRFEASCFTTAAQMSRIIRSGRHGCKRSSRICSAGGLGQTRFIVRSGRAETRNCRASIRWFWFSVAGDIVRKTAGMRNSWSNSTVRWKSDTAVWSRSAPTTSP